MQESRTSRSRLIGLAVAVILIAPVLPTASPAWASGAAVVERATATADVSQADLQGVVNEAYAKYASLDAGANADYIPGLAKVPSSLFGVAIVTADGRVFTAGDVDHVFSMQSVSKPFTAALVMQQQGLDVLRKGIGLEPTGFPFNSIEAIELQPLRTGNPLVNAGAISTVSLLHAPSPKAKYRMIEDWFGEFASAKLAMLPRIYRSEAATNTGNRAIAALLAKYGRIYADPLESVDVYTRQCSIGVTARQLGVMGATLANGGVNPLTGKRLLDARYVPELLAIMMMAGFYDESGQWAVETGLPAKTGVSGGIVAVVPGQMAIVGFSPRLNRAGNSIRASNAIEFIAGELGVNVFGSGQSPTVAATASS